MIRLLVPYIAVAVSVIAVVQGIQLNSEQHAIESVTTENRAVSCALADLVAHVPAVQFEGESRANFVGWIEARQDILIAARVEDVCDPTVVNNIERRVALDDRVLETLK